MLKRTICVMLMVIMLMLVLPLYGCTSTQGKIINELKHMNLEAATKLYDEKGISDKERGAFIADLTTLLHSSVSMYAEDSIDYDTAMELVYTIEYMAMDRIDDEIYEVRSKHGKLYNSKNAYKEGNSLLEGKNYVASIERFKAVIEDDCRYADAQAAIATALDGLFSTIDEHITEGEFIEAIGILTSANTIIPENDRIAEKLKQVSDAYKQGIFASADDFVAALDYNSALDVLQSAYNYFDDNNDITAKMEAIQTAYEAYLYQCEIDELKVDLDGYADTGDYASLFSMLDEFQAEHGDDGELQALYNDYLDTYVQMIVKKATQARIDKEYLKALNMLNSALQIVSDSRLDAELVTLNAEKPTYLVEMKCANNHNCSSAEQGSSHMDTVGNLYPYNYGNLFIMYGDGSASYNLNYSFKTLYITLAPHDNSYDRTGTYKIIGDGEVLYELVFTRTTTPQTIKLDVSNVNWLEFRQENAREWYGTFNVIMADCYFEK